MSSPRARHTIATRRRLPATSASIAAVTSAVNSIVSSPPDVQHANPELHASSAAGTSASGVGLCSARSVARVANHSTASAHAVPSTRDDSSGGMPGTISTPRIAVHRKFV